VAIKSVDLYVVVRVRWHRLKGSRSLSHLVMSLVLVYVIVCLSVKAKTKKTYSDRADIDVTQYAMYYC